jgi:RNA polymerase sigma factor (sigma-70 family)
VPDATDLELVDRFRRDKDQSAFEELVRRHGRWIERLCARLLRSDTLAAYAAQEVFTRAFERIDTLRGENVAGWLKVIAVHTSLNLIEREKRWAPLEHAGTPAAVGPAADVQLIGIERLALAQRLIARLSQKQKIVFCLKYIDGCSYEEIERLTGFSSTEVKSYLQNARRNFENWWRAGEEAAWMPFDR